MRTTSLFRILGQLHDRPWAITSRALESIVQIVEQHGEMDLEAVAAKLGRPLDNHGNTVQIRNGVAIMGVEGPLFRYANVLTEVSGATSVQVLATDFQSALDNPHVHQILLNINSPGGEVDGIQEFADQIREGAKIKPVTAYVDGLAASGGYWLASAAPRVIAGESSLLGSIGVVASLRDNRGAQERQGVKTYEIVSSKSPFKRPDPATDEGRGQILEMVDSLADIFIGRVAAFRGVSVETVESSFGQGKTLVASRAVAAGMADEIGSFEPLVARLAAESTPRAISIAAQEDTRMADTTLPAVAQPAPAAPPEPTPAPVTALVPTGTLTAANPERQRIAAILNAPESHGRESMALALALETDLTPEAARRVLAASPVTTPAPPANALAERMAHIANPTVGLGAAEDQETEAAEAARILAFVPKSQRRAS
jgi:signal peptide peptidase SppA